MLNTSLPDFLGEARAAAALRGARPLTVNGYKPPIFEALVRPRRAGRRASMKEHPDDLAT